MSPRPLTPVEARALLEARVDRGWLEEVESTAEGRALVAVAVALVVAADQADAVRAGSLAVRAHSQAAAPPAGGALYATTTLRLRLRRPLRTPTPLRLLAGTVVMTRDGHRVATDTDLVWAPGEVGVARTTGATALLPGQSFVIPPGEVDRFAPVLEGLSGAGSAVALVDTAAPVRAIRLRTSLVQPHPFRRELLGRVVELSEGAGALAANDGRQLQLVTLNNGADVANPAGPENEYAWALPLNTTLNASYATWATGAGSYLWRLVPWDELLEVENTTDVTGGREPVLDELARGRGRPRQPDEGDEAVRGRLLRPASPPTPLGVLRALLAAVAPYGVRRGDLRIYELGQTAPDAEDPYAANFPAAAGFIGDLHTTDMASPETPEAMAARAPDGSTLASYVSPGLALVPLDAVRPDVVIRWDPPAGMPAATVAEVRRLLMTATHGARPPGVIAQLYHPPAWRYPG